MTTQCEQEELSHLNRSSPISPPHQSGIKTREGLQLVFSFCKRAVEAEKYGSEVALKGCLIGGLLLLVASVWVLSLVPPVSKDALTHHLAVPKLWLRHKGMYEIPFMPYSYFPMNLDLLYLIPLWLGSDIAPKFIHFAFALLTGLMVFRYLKEKISSEYALLGALFFLSLPIIVKLSITVYVDLGLIFFSTASLLLVLKWLNRGFKIRYLIYSAIMCGLAMGTKYNGLITFFLLTLFVVFLRVRYSRDRRDQLLEASKCGLLFFSISIAIFFPWMIRNFVLTDNPIYPLYDQWFNPASHAEHASIGIFAYRALVYHEKWWEILFLPVRVFFQGQDGSPQFFDGKLNPFLLLFPILAFVQTGDDPEQIRIEKKILLAFSVLYFSFAFFSSSLRIRYISPIIPPLVILSIFGVRKAIAFAGRLGSPIGRNMACLVIIGSICTAIGMNARYIVGQFRYVRPLDYLTGKVSRDAYIEKYRPEYPVIQFINKKLPGTAKILFIFMGNRGYYCDRRYVFDMVWNKSTMEQTLKKSHSPKVLMKELRKKGLTHILINIPIFNRWVTRSFEPGDKLALRYFFNKCARPIYCKNGYCLYELLSVNSL